MSSETPSLAFADEHVPRILSGQKTATIRLDLDSRIQLGRSVTFVDSERERFATAVVDDRGYERLAVLARQGVPGHKQYEQPADLVAEMHEYYPDRRVTGDTLADVLYWGVSHYGSDRDAPDTVRRPAAGRAVRRNGVGRDAARVPV